MYLILNNIDTGALYAKRITEQVNRAEFQVSYAHDKFAAVEKLINIFIENHFNHNLDGIEEILNDALTDNKSNTIKVLRKLFFAHGELVKIMLEETQFCSLSKFLISSKDKDLACTMTRRSEMTIQEIYKESYHY
ncbi:hypothetical protein [Pseudomonas fluorescens]|uniref:hypothetical protein n=1 Tax=Pseudomonas fluorescens TaxID=294 RepID=UPI00058A728F|nr:hypothetical protein [Pseudomonas fluorescens]CEL31220.1 hypothetical protein SRM1_04584 [Pseudomonas fluorescens]